MEERRKNGARRKRRKVRLNKIFDSFIFNDDNVPWLQTNLAIALTLLFSSSLAKKEQIRKKIYIYFVLFAAKAASATIELADESEEAGVEVQESVTVEVEEIHPLPEVSMV